MDSPWLLRIAGRWMRGTGAEKTALPAMLKATACGFAAIDCNGALLRRARTMRWLTGGSMSQELAQRRSLHAQGDCVAAPHP